MSDDSKEIQITQNGAEWADTARVYVNNVQVVVSQWEVSLYVAETIPIPGPNQTVVAAVMKPRMVLTMSREHFQAFSEAVEKTAAGLKASPL